MKDLSSFINESKFRSVTGKERDDVLNSAIEEVKKYFKGHESSADFTSICAVMYRFLNKMGIKWMGFLDKIHDAAEKLEKEIKKKR